MVLFGDVLAHIPQVGVMSTSLGALPRPVPRPLARRHPSGFAGVSYATVLGLVVGLSSCCLLVAVAGVDGVGHKSVRGCGCGCWPRVGSSGWSSSVSMELVSLVFDVMGVVAGRGVGRLAGRRRC